MTSDALIYLTVFVFLYLPFAILTADIIFTMTLTENDLNEYQRKILLARSAICGLIWPLFWAVAVPYLLFKGVRLVLRYGFRSMES